MVKDPIDKLVTRYDMSIEQKKKITTMVATTTHTPKYINNFLGDPVLEMLPLDQRIDAITACSQYHFSKTTLVEFVKRGYSLAQATEMVQFAKYFNPSMVNTVATPDGEAAVPNLANILGYENIMFLDEMSGNTHDAHVVESIVNTIEETMDELQTEQGIAEVVYKLRELPKSELQICETAVMRAVNNITHMYDLAREPFEEDSQLEHLGDVTDSLEKRTEHDWYNE